MQGTQVQFVGNLAGDPELRYTNSGTAVANFTVAVNNRVKDGDGWKDGEPTWIRVAVWMDYGEHVADSLSKGDQVFVTGRLITRQWEDNEGKTRTSVDVTADEVGPTLRWTTAKLSKVPRKDAGGQEAKPSSKGDFNDAPPF